MLGRSGANASTNAMQNVAGNLANQQNQYENQLAMGQLNQQTGNQFNAAAGLQGMDANQVSQMMNFLSLMKGQDINSNQTGNQQSTGTQNQQQNQIQDYWSNQQGNSNIDKTSRDSLFGMGSQALGGLGSLISMF
jgi:hypothetical protein